MLKIRNTLFIYSIGIFPWFFIHLQCNCDAKRLKCHSSNRNGRRLSESGVYLVGRRDNIEDGIKSIQPPSDPVIMINAWLIGGAHRPSDPKTFIMGLHLYLCHLVAKRNLNWWIFPLLLDYGATVLSCWVPQRSKKNLWVVAFSLLDYSDLCETILEPFTKFLANLSPSLFSQHFCFCCWIIKIINFYAAASSMDRMVEWRRRTGIEAFGVGHAIRHPHPR